MSQFNRATLVGGGPPRNTLANLRDVQIIESKTVLPAEIISSVLDHVSAPDMIRCARASRRMREMVYEDSRWIQKLRMMDCWNEAEARARTHKLRSEDTLGEEIAEASSEAPQAPNGTVLKSNLPSEQHSDLLRDLLPEEQQSITIVDGFDATGMPSRPRSSSSSSTVRNNVLLEVMSMVQSIRGEARSEYGRVHVALNPYYKDAVRTKHAANAKIFRTFRDPIQQAQMVAQVVRFANSDTSPGRTQRKERLGAMVNAFEDAVAREYEQGLRTGDVDGRMRKYANVLITLNGGKRAVQEFISLNPLLTSKAKLGDPMDCFSPSSSDMFFLEEAVSFFRYLTSAFNEQLQIISRVFPPSVNVAKPLLEKISDEILSPYLNKVFDTAHSKSTESYLRATSGTFEQCLSLKSNLKPPASLEVFEQTFIEVLVNIYSPHFQTYLDSEQAFFKRRSDTEVNGWERQLIQQDASIESIYMANVNRQADKRDFMSSFKKVVMMPVNALPAFPFGTKSVSKESSGEKLDIQRSQTPSRTQTSTPSAKPPRTPSPFLDPPTTELAARAAIMKSRLEGIKSLFSLEVALSLVHMAKASLERTAVFAKDQTKFKDDARSQCEIIFITLLKTLGNRHVRAGFDKAVDHLARYNPRAVNDRDAEASQGVAPLAVFLELVNVGDLIQQMIDVFFEQELIANKLTDRNDFLSPVLKEKKRFEQMLDERVAAGLNKGIEVLMAEVEYLTATTQNADDYNPGVTSSSKVDVIDTGPSITAVRVVDVVSAHVTLLVGSTDKNILDVFNQEVGLRLFQTICKHLKRQRISVAGSIRLISDINHYFSFIQSLKNKDLLQYFMALRELSQIYLIDPDNAKEMATIIADTDRYLGIFRPEEVYEFAERRADWYQVKMKVEKAMYGMDCRVM